MHAAHRLRFPADHRQQLRDRPKVILHGCTIGDDRLIGMGAIMLNGSKIGSNCLVGAGAVVTEGKTFPIIR